MTESTGIAKAGAWAPNAEEIVGLIAHALEVTSGSPRVVRIEAPVPRTEPRAWLRAQQSPAKTYWSDRNGQFEMAGVGAADLIAGRDPAPYERLFARMRGGLSCAHPNLRYYGGMCFDPTRLSDPRWMRFGAYRFVLPRFELLNTGDGSFFVCNALSRGREKDAEELRAIRDDLGAMTFPGDAVCAEISPITARHDCPDRGAWDGIVQRTLQCIQDGPLEKAVLARESFFEFQRPIDVMSVLERLNERGSHAYLFCLQPQTGIAFVGATPERLCRRVGGYVQSEALAGTRPRGDSDVEDTVFGASLLHDDKERREHRFVVDGIRKALHVLCKDVRGGDEVSLLRLRECQHLLCRFEGILAEGKSDADVLRALHPSPAVGGWPTREAVAWIAEQEPFDRGWYAGPIGWVGYESCDFAVAIRSGIVDGTTLSLYSGAGIVHGSTPDREWDEIENKISTFLNVLIHAVE